MMGSWCLCLVLHVLCLSLVITTLTKDNERPRFRTQRDTERPLSRSQLGPGEYTCGEGYCRCNDTFADCSRFYGKLTYVPCLPETVLKLDFSWNYIARVIDVNFFHNATNFIWLDFSSTGLADLNPEALGPLKHLEFIDLSRNSLTEIRPEALRRLKHLKYLFLTENKLSEISPAALSPLKQLLYLDLPHNRLREISFEAASHLRYLEHLDLSYNRLSDISPAAVQSLKRLKYLDLSNNTHLTYNTLAPVFSLAALRVLKVSFCRFGALPDNLFAVPPTPQVEFLDVSFNRIAPFNMTILRLLINLKFLNADKNYISTGLVTDYLPRLQYLKLTNNGLYTFPKTCDERDVSLFPNLQKMDLSGNLIESVGRKCICLPELNILILTGNKFEFSVKYAFSQQQFPALNELYLSASNFFLEDYIFSNSKLEILYLGENGIDFINGPPNIFAGCDNLRYLDVSGNILDYKRIRGLFGNLTKLQYLDLRNTRLERISAHTFRNFRSLTELRLNDNKLGTLPAGAFDNLPNLSKLRLQRNKISVVSPDTFGADTRKRLRELDIGNNPFSCSCDIMWFQEWLKSKPSLFFKWWTSPQHYMCANIPDMTVLSFYMPEQACLLTHEASSFIIYTTALLISALTLAVNLYRFRWHIRLVLYEAFRGRGERWRHLQEGHFQYDVFVSYDSKDLGWVRAHLIPELEERNGLKLCLHERDFIPGNPIVDNISDCVEASKKVLMLFSTNFAHSQWCQFELNFCLRHVMDYDDALVVVMLHDIPARDLTTAMMAVMKTTTYIEWDDTPDARASFWGRLRIAFREIMPARRVVNM